jgi:hypothetical protein
VHDGGEGDFVGFAFFNEAAVEGCKPGASPRGMQGCRAKDSSECRAPAPYSAFAS